MAENPDRPLTVETHPFAPFLPEKAKILILGSFPPKQERWSMDFFYPNFNNDMWRIFGLVFFGDRNRFIAADGKHFDKTRITAFCEEKGIALYDTAYRAARLKDNASDKFLETVEPAPIAELIESLPLCRTMAATGQKAAETVSGMFRCPVPATGFHRVPAHIPSVWKRKPRHTPAYSKKSFSGTAWKAIFATLLS